MAASSWRRLLASRLVVLFIGFKPLSYTVNLVPIRLDLQRKHNRKNWSYALCVCWQCWEKQHMKSIVGPFPVYLCIMNMYPDYVIFRCCNVILQLEIWTVFTEQHYNYKCTVIWDWLLNSLLHLCLTFASNKRTTKYSHSAPSNWWQHVQPDASLCKMVPFAADVKSINLKKNSPPLQVSLIVEH